MLPEIFVIARCRIRPNTRHPGVSVGEFSGTTQYWSWCRILFVGYMLWYIYTNEWLAQFEYNRTIRHYPIPIIILPRPEQPRINANVCSIAFNAGNEPSLGNNKALIFAGLDRPQVVDTRLFCFDAYNYCYIIHQLFRVAYSVNDICVSFKSLIHCKKCTHIYYTMV